MDSYSLWGPGGLGSLLSPGRSLVLLRRSKLRSSPVSQQSLLHALCHQVPEGFTAVMSADTWEARGPDRFFFRMSQPIPCYLIALAIGDLASAEVGPR